MSAIAATNIDILDDEDLHERLKLLEWLLLADIPEREIRPDTRAAFAAGQIAALAPILIQEGDGLIEATRLLATLESNAPEPERAAKVEIERYQAEVGELTKRVAELRNEHQSGEERHLRRCLGLLLQAFGEYPAKARLFFRMHQYCRVTGFKGLNKIGDWIKDARARGHGVWADYYAGLSLQILAKGLLLSARSWNKDDALVSDKEAALRHMEDVSHIDTRAFFVQHDRESWFHAVGRKEFGVALLSAAEAMRSDPVGARLEALAQQYLSVSLSGPAETWELETSRSPGVWAHFTESVLSLEGRPTAAWKRFDALFSFSHLADMHAARRYPEFISNSGWSQLVHSREPLPETDSGWLREAMEGNDKRVKEALSSKKVAFTRAARSLKAPPKGWTTLKRWTQLASQEYSPFDPRLSEWTALEIIRQIVSRTLDLVGDNTVADRLHPNNVLLPDTWRTKYPRDPVRAGVSWEAWREFAKPENNGQIKLRDSATSILDYRYSTDTQAGRRLDDWERYLVGIGRLLLGLLRLNYEVPRIWNFRGNEQIFILPRTHWFQALAISSPTLMLMEGCLSGRSAETRAIALKPALFGWAEGVDANDADFDPPLVLGSNELLDAIVKAQRVLENHQISVALNQPRQLIPFRLSDFATGPDGEGAEDGGG